MLLTTTTKTFIPWCLAIPCNNPYLLLKYQRLRSDHFLPEAVKACATFSFEPKTFTHIML